MSAQKSKSDAVKMYNYQVVSFVKTFVQIRTSKSTASGQAYAPIFLHSLTHWLHAHSVLPHHKKKKKPHICTRANPTEMLVAF